MMFVMVPISKEFMEQLTIQNLVQTVMTQNSSFENEFHIMMNDEMKSCSEAEQRDWLHGIQKEGKSKKSLIELLFRRGEYLVNLRRAKELKIKEELEQSKIAVEAIRSTPQNRHMSSRQVDDIPKLYVNERDRVDEWIYMVEAEDRYQGISHDNFLDGVTKLLRGMALQTLRNLRKNGESILWERFKSYLTATLKKL
ncbi:unnamed protein product [Brachionus calyciflorus]|uniref:Uncharacterized protein n=1 Tax=Brachionus calyciflorus TaxID=104777 RepID=A0A813ZCI1_9BILA|nr:unnamed protein product [Brachionus calyciflorus]